MNLKDYADAFYGELSESQYLSRKDVVEKASKLIADDIAKEVPQIESELLRGAVHKAFLVMRSLGAKHPVQSYQNLDFGTEAFRHAMAFTRGVDVAVEFDKEETPLTVAERNKASVERTQARLAEHKQDEVDREAMRKFHREQTEPIYEAYKNLKDYYIQRVEDYKVAAYVDLLSMDVAQVADGYAYFYLFWKLPVEDEIFDEDAVIEATNAHPSGRRMERGKTKLRAWPHTFKEAMPI